MDLNVTITAQLERVTAQLERVNVINHKEFTAVQDVKSVTPYQLRSESALTCHDTKELQCKDRRAAMKRSNAQPWPA